MQLYSFLAPEKDNSTQYNRLTPKTTISNQQNSAESSSFLSAKIGPKLSNVCQQRNT